MLTSLDEQRLLAFIQVYRLSDSLNVTVSGAKRLFYLRQCRFSGIFDDDIRSSGERFSFSEPSRSSQGAEWPFSS